MALSCLCVITNDISSQYKELLHQQIEINTIISLAIINKTEIRRITMESCRRPDSVLFLFPPFGKLYPTILGASGLVWSDLVASDGLLELSRRKPAG